MSTGTGTNVSKGVVFTLLEPQPGESASKAVAYTLLETMPGLNVSKAVTYTLLESTNSNPPVWQSFTFAPGVVGVAYSQQWDLAPAAPPTTYTLQSGSLPPGLSLSNVSNDVGKLSGTPTTAGTYTFQLLATNAYGTAVSPTFTLTVSSPAVGNLNSGVVA